MASVSNYTFENMSRIGSDECCVSQTDLQNIGFANYMLQNYFASDCSMKTPMALATSQPGVFYSGGHNSGAGGCNIDDSSDLQIGSIQTHPKSKLDLFHRPFATVPFLGRGSVNPVMEAQIMQGELLVNKRSVNNLSETSYIKYYQTPLLASVKERIDNNNATNDSPNGYVRGGLPSRELTRDTK
jgi:hypothetical protein